MQRRKATSLDRRVSKYLESQERGSEAASLVAPDYEAYSDNTPVAIVSSGDYP